MKKEPNRFRAIYLGARAAQAAGEKAKAGEYYRQLVAMCVKGDAQRSELTEARSFAKAK